MYYTTIYTSNKKGPLEKELTIVDPVCDAVERNKDHITKMRREPGGTGLIASLLRGEGQVCGYLSILSKIFFFETSSKKKSDV